MIDFFVKKSILLKHALNEQKLRQKILRLKINEYCNWIRTKNNKSDTDSSEGGDIKRANN
jgi:hypothetical protein